MAEEETAFESHHSGVYSVVTTSDLLLHCSEGKRSTPKVRSGVRAQHVVSFFQQKMALNDVETFDNTLKH